MRNRTVPLLLLALVACGGAAAPTGPWGSGTGTGGGQEPPAPTPLDTTGWVVAEPGTMPLVLTAPHGGELSPDGLPTRSCAGCSTSNDTNTQELARAVADAIQQRTGHRPFLVINRLHRRKFDANRDVTEATGGYQPLEVVWRGYHGAIDSARARALRVHPRALLLDLHGHAHAIARLELGYLLSGSELRLSDSLVGTKLGTSSIARLGLDAGSGDRGAALIRGPNALGSLLVAASIPAVPSALDPAPASGQDYFNGGYTTQRHGSVGGAAMDAIQIEHHYAGIRDTPAARARYAAILAEAVTAFLERHYGWTP